MDYGEGTIRIDRATIFMIKMMRAAIKRWKLSAEAVELVWQRAAACEDWYPSKGTMQTKKAIYCGNEKDISPSPAPKGKGKDD